MIKTIFPPCLVRDIPRAWKTAKQRQRSSTIFLSMASVVWNVFSTSFSTVSETLERRTDVAVAALLFICRPQNDAKDLNLRIVYTQFSRDKRR